MNDKRLIYLDHSASTPVDERVVAAMLPYFTQSYGNASGLHRQARASARALDESRRSVADVLKCQPGEIVFTGCGTESINLALRGVALACQRAGRGNHLITSPVEHHAVSHTIEHLCHYFGFERSVVPVNGYGQVDPGEVRRAIRPDTVLISIMYANNEVGTIQPVAEIGTLARERDVYSTLTQCRPVAILIWT